ncbi:MAG: YqiJ family protein [Chloroflexaceae bacterium]|nr:YqiJ family protein [Chloroflexaceae bacterium]
MPTLTPTLTADADVDADTDGDVDANTDGDVDADTAAASSGGGGCIGGMLAVLGVGRVPLLIIIMVFLLGFGATGLLTNVILENMIGSYPNMALLPVTIFSLALTVLITNRTGALVAALAPGTSTAIGIEQLVGRAGVVVSHSVSTTYGRVQVRDRHGIAHTIYAVVSNGDPLPDQTEVAIVAYDAAQRRFLVEALGALRKRST